MLGSGGHRLAGAVLVIGLVCSCPPSKQRACLTTEECPEEEICIDRWCHIACGTNDDCGSEQTCRHGFCVASTRTDGSRDLASLDLKPVDRQGADRREADLVADRQTVDLATDLQGNADIEAFDLPQPDSNGRDSTQDSDLDHPDRLDADLAAIEPGCSDGEREGLLDLAMFPDVAACQGSFPRGDLRRPATGGACGDDLGPCSSPAALCQPGWGLCGHDGDPGALAARLGATECSGLTGAFVAAMSHCTAPSSGCAYETPYPCTASGHCSEPVCCGALCRSGGCINGVWSSSTYIALGQDRGCGDIGSGDNDVTGVLCCMP